MLFYSHTPDEHAFHIQIFLKSDIFLQYRNYMKYSTEIYFQEIDIEIGSDLAARSTYILYHSIYRG